MKQKATLEHGKNAWASALERYAMCVLRPDKDGNIILDQCYYL